MVFSDSRKPIRIVRTDGKDTGNMCLNKMQNADALAIPDVPDIIPALPILFSAQLCYVGAAIVAASCSRSPRKRYMLMIASFEIKVSPRCAAVELLTGGAERSMPGLEGFQGRTVLDVSGRFLGTVRGDFMYASIHAYMHQRPIPSPLAISLHRTEPYIPGRVDHTSRGRDRLTLFLLTKSVGSSVGALRRPTCTVVLVRNAGRLLGAPPSHRPSLISYLWRNTKATPRLPLFSSHGISSWRVHSAGDALRLLSGAAISVAIQCIERRLVREDFPNLPQMLLKHQASTGTDSSVRPPTRPGSGPQTQCPLQGLRAQV
jgi:hypothetical protein